MFEGNREKVKEIIAYKVNKGAGSEAYVKAAELVQLGYYFDSIISEKHCKKS